MAKKKILDLTINEINRICDNNDRCPNCPLILFNPGTKMICFQDLLESLPFPSTYWEREVEVPKETK